MSEERVPDTPEVQAAKADALRAEAEKSRAEARKATAEAEAAEFAAETARQESELDKRSYKILLNSNDRHHIYRFNKEIDAKSVSDCVDRLETWRRIDSECDVTLVFNSPGGSVVDGMALWDYLTELKADGHKVTTIARGMAASMAGILLQAGTTRVMGKEAWLLIHQIQAGMLGSWGQIQDRVEWLKKVQEHILDIFAERMSATTDISARHARNLVKKNWERTDWWIDAAEALKLGLIDEIR